MTTKPDKSRAALPARHHYTLLGQLLKLVPRGIISDAAAQSGAEAKARSFSPVSHLAAMLFAQMAHALSLNDVCDWLRLKARAIAAWGVTPPSRNNLSHANKVRDASFIETVFWRTLEHFQRSEPAFGTTRPGKGARRLLHRFKVRIHAIDSTVMELVANCMNWAKHRRRSRSPGGGAETDCEARAARRAKEP